MTLNVKSKRFIFSRRIKRRTRYLLKKLYQVIFPSHGSRAVFVLGSGRSGTDIVAHCLSKAWDTELINEDNPKAFENWRFKDLETVCHAVDSSSAKLVLFKPIVETLRGQEFLGNFSDSSILFVTRNPFDAVNSMVRFFGDGHVKAVKSWVVNDFAQNPLVPTELKQFITDHVHEELSREDASGLYWLMYNTAFHFLGLHTDSRAMLLTYEDMVQNPEATMKQVCQFLHLKWSSSMVSEVYGGSLGKNPSPNLSPEIEKACLDQWERLTGKCLPGSN